MCCQAKHSLQTRESQQRVRKEGQRMRHSKKKRACCFCKRASHLHLVCPAKAKVCLNCNTRRHFAPVCQENAGSQKGVSSLEREVEMLCLGVVEDSNRAKSSRLVEVCLNDTPMTVKTDTGAGVSAISSTFPSLSLILQPVNKFLPGPSGQSPSVAGKFVGTLTWQDSSSTSSYSFAVSF